MLSQAVVRRQPRYFHSAWVVVCVLLALLPLMTIAPASDISPRVDPFVSELAAQNPQATVKIIVQKLTRDRSAEQLVWKLGGAVTNDLRMIDAFAAELPASAVPQLAKAAGVRWVSLDAPLHRSGDTNTQGVAPAQLRNAYVHAIGADRVRAENAVLQGQGIGVAVVDTGVATHADIGERIVASVALNDAVVTPADRYGHGTHVAGIVGGDGSGSAGARPGVAPGVNLVNVKVSTDDGIGTEADVIAGLQWVYDHKDRYNIRVVNLSLSSSVPAAAHTSPLNAAVEMLWFNRVVVVVAAGNNGNGALYPPANDPFVITVGATDDQGTLDLSDDVLAAYSSYGKTTKGISKPDLVAPGTNIISLLAGGDARLAVEHASHVEGEHYFRMSGTSMASAVTAGAAALLLQDEPGLNPDQVKHRLMTTAKPFDQSTRAGAGHLDVYAAVHGTTTEGANTGMPVSQLLWASDQAIVWDGVSWNAIKWNAIKWNAIKWNGVDWDTE